MPLRIGIDRPVSWRRLLAAGLTAAAAAGLAGGAFELWRFGPGEDAAQARVERHIRDEFHARTSTLAAITARIATDPAAARGLAQRADDAARALFDLVAAAVAEADLEEPDTAVTLYGATARAWVGRASDIPAESDRISGPPAFFLAQSPAGLRLVHVRPVVGAEGGRVGTVAAESLVSPSGPHQSLKASDYTVATPLAPVSLHMRWEGAGEGARPGAFLVRAPSGEPLAEAAVSLEDLREARLRVRQRTGAAVLFACGVTLYLLVGPLLDRRGRATDARAILRTTLGAALLVIAGTALTWIALGAFRTVSDHAPALALLGSAAAAIVALFVLPVTRLPLHLRRSRRAWGAAPVRFVVSQFAAGALVAALILAFGRTLELAVDPEGVDLRHFSLHPWNTTRLILLGGVLALHTAILWGATLVLAAFAAGWRRRGGRRTDPLLFLLWVVPAALAAGLAVARGWPFSAPGLLLTASACAIAALLMKRAANWYRHTTVAARIFGLFLALLVPALLLYPPVDVVARRATERLITTRFAVEAQQHPQTIIERMNEARDQIDAIPILAELVGDVDGETVTFESAFLVWSQTVLAEARLTSSVELYGPNGNVPSRFALNLPEYTGTAQKPQPNKPCEWDVFGEGASFGWEERSMLHAERNVCVDDGTGTPRLAGTIVVHVALDYQTLPFITSQSPYLEVFRPAEEGTPREGTPGGDVEIAIYGWGLRPIYTSGAAAWPIEDALFQRIYMSRDPFWTEIPRGNQTWRVYLANDRWRIFAIGYPRLTLFDRFVHIAELTTLAGVLCLIVLLGTALFTRAARERPRVGRALLLEIRASFYRKLFLAFVLASIVPVITLALVIRTYFAELLWADVQAAAARTAAVAQRVIEGSDALVRGSDGSATISDDVMIWISQVIDQDVNIFQDERLAATSERDLFASGLLPTRTPASVYRAIAIQRQPSFVDEDTIGTFPYMIAAAPVRAGGRDAILTVPLTTRQREIEREIDELDRGVHLAALFFILLGAGIGLSLAERIADPVRRLTRATRRIAEGDFDARIAVRSADELKRLVDAFNGMAAELKAQREQLERTHRLEAWAEMARQVAHEIKNPLTPIQLSAEHLRRVHADRGEPMGPVLETCVTSILGQVRLLRQIAGEFSTFASSPTARRAPVDVPELVADVVDPYRAGLAGRIDVTNRVAPPLPPVLVDRTLIARALANIVENALHAMPGEGSLTVDAAVEDGWLVLSFRDTGVGMDEEALGRIFEPYFSTKTSGTGLGLPIARRNVEVSGGTVDVESARGRGTTVRMRLPLTGNQESSS